MDCAIRLENLGKKYKNNRGIEDMNLDIARGEVFGLLGPNGAGKTTAMKIMTGLLTPDIGDVYLNGFSIENEYERAMSEVGCIIESVCMFPYLTALENLKLCARFYPDVDEKRMDYVLELVHMQQFKKERVKNFSLGMRQRMGIAMAILSDPKILILDEPLNGLDVEGMVDMRNIFRQLSEEKNTTVFISSHLIHDVELTCDRVGVVLGGKIVDVENMENVLRDYATLENYYLSEVDRSVEP